MRRAIRAARPIRRERGQVVVEFAILLPILMLFLVGVLQFGLWFWTSSDLASGTREAGRLLLASKDDVSAIQHVEDRLAENLSSDINTSKLTYSFSPTPASSTPLWASGTTVTMSVSYPDQLNVMGLVVGNPNMTSSAQVRIQ